ncbi:retrovirus-related pol polyprotein from transposon TNT 1-94 [Tanacetum coccineum]
MCELARLPWFTMKGFVWASDLRLSDHSLTEKINVLQEQNELFRAENGKIKQHYKELYDSIKTTRAKHLEQTTALLTENESLKVQIQNKLSCVNKDQVKPKVLAPRKYAIDVEPIPPRNRNNREVHLVYLKHLKESVETLREIVEEAKPRAIPKKNRNLALAKSVRTEKVEEHPRTIKSSLKTTNRVDSSISSKHTFLRSKDETPEVVIKFLKQIQVGLNKTVRNIRTDNGTEFVNKDLTDYYERVGIFHQKTVPRTPQQNDVVERQNRTLVEAARTMLIFSKAPMFLWAEAVATACYTQNRSFIHTRHCKTPYES